MPRPIAVVADGNVKVAWVPTLTVAAPTAAQAIAGTDLSCYLTSDGWVPSLDQAIIADDRLCDIATFQNPGRKTENLQVRYTYNPNTPAENVAFTTLVPNTAGYFVVRWGLANATAFAVGQKIDFYPVTCGAQLKQPPEANSVLHVTQKMFITSTTVADIALV